MRAYPADVVKATLEAIAETGNVSQAAERVGVPVSTAHDWLRRARQHPETSVTMTAREPIGEVWDRAQRTAAERGTALVATEVQTPEQAAQLLQAVARFAQVAANAHLNVTVGRRGATTMIGTQINGSDVLLAMAEARRMLTEGTPGPAELPSCSRLPLLPLRSLSGS